MLIYFWPYGSALQFCLSVKIIDLLVFIYSAFWFRPYGPALLKVIELRYPFPFPPNLILLVPTTTFLYRPALNKTPL